MTKNQKTDLATFGAGCFWHVEEGFRELPGVKKTTVGFMGGRMERPSYEDVSFGDTGHAEVVQIEYDPATVSYDNLLKKFWEIHDPTTPNRQGPDVGEQYRSVIFYHTPEQKLAAEKSKAEVAKSSQYTRPIVTEIESAAAFYPAEEYHQKYLLKRGSKTC